MNRTRKPKAISFLLKKSELQHNTNLISKLDILLQSTLKQHNIQGCRIGNFQNNQLLIEIPDATWQLRLQFIRNELISVLRKEVPGLLNIKIKVNPRLKQTKNNPKSKVKKTMKRASKMPSDVAQSFLDLANASDPALQKALRSLAEYSQKTK